MISAKTAFLAVHLVGLALGIGASAFVEMRMLPRLAWRPMEAADVALLEDGARLVALGLVLLWISGTALLWHAALHEPWLLASPKVRAKFTVVVLLTANGLLLHAVVLPRVVACVGSTLRAAMAPAWLALAVACGAVSATGWAYCLALGIARDLNWAFPFGTYVMAWGLAVGLAWCGGMCAAVRRG